jgi:hypothetical protein
LAASCGTGRRRDASTTGVQQQAARPKDLEDIRLLKILEQEAQR